MKVKAMANNALIAALYVGITYITASFAFLGVQFRIAEILLFLAFFRKDYSLGLTLGCVIANAISPMGWVDVVFGTAATILTLVGITHSKHLVVASLFPVIFNGFIVGAELYYVLELPFWLSVAQVMIGEFVVVTLGGVLVFSQLRKNKHFLDLILADQNI